MQTKKRDSNNFISVILDKINLAVYFKKRVAFNLTRRIILRHIRLNFYIRKRYDEFFLYIRVQSQNFGSQRAFNIFMRDICTLIPNLQLDSIKGHYKGWKLQILENREDLIYFLKLISLLSRPQDFYVKLNKSSLSFYNKPESSHVPVHLQITNTKLQNIESSDLASVLWSVKTCR